MDRIEELMKDAKPRVVAPGTAPEIFRSVVSSTDPNVVALAAHTAQRRTGARATAAIVLAAAAVVGAVVIGGNLMPEPAPGPAQSRIPAPAASASTPPASLSASATPSVPAPLPAPTLPSATASTSAAALTTGGVACTPANIDQLRNDQQRTILPIPPTEQPYYTVLGCADGWLAYSISDDGGRALQLDGGNAWFRLAKLQNGRFLWDVRQPWATVFNWEFQALNNQGLTPQQAMDQEFAQKGIPVELRSQLVGDGPPAG
ncbi:hypothetical protein [Arthrobacter sp. B3I4]|uniref:hypothetical protein n=1 Tax=Arthrobacter sp. B3I4 TaxID=3042267 RepID=UPI00277E2646|nr:hypothetical protein [Arthrobacter sp. B3I4]MDQ0756846.1 hypothetical protein [Arthrobacter sp. B3I4]